MCHADKGERWRVATRSAPPISDMGVTGPQRSATHGLLLQHGGWDLRQVTLTGKLWLANRSWMFPALPASLIPWGQTSQPPSPIPPPHSSSWHLTSKRIPHRWTQGQTGHHTCVVQTSGREGQANQPRQRHGEPRGSRLKSARRRRVPAPAMSLKTGRRGPSREQPLRPCKQNVQRSRGREGRGPQEEPEGGKSWQDRM